MIGKIIFLSFKLGMYLAKRKERLEEKDIILYNKIESLCKKHNNLRILNHKFSRFSHNPHFKLELVLQDGQTIEDVEKMLGEYIMT